MNLQNTILNELITEKVPVMLYLMNGFQQGGYCRLRRFRYRHGYGCETAYILQVCYIHDSADSPIEISSTKILSWIQRDGALFPHWL